MSKSSERGRVVCQSAQSQKMLSADAFPVHIPPDHLEKFPKFSELVSQLKSRLSPDGTSLPLQKSLDQARHNLSQARNTWLMNHLVHSELSELLAELEVRGQDGGLSLSEKQFKDILARVLAYGELENYLNFQPDPTSRSTLFGLSAQDIARHNPVAQHVPAVQQTALPMIEDRLRQKCEKLYNFYIGDTDEESRSEQLMIAKSRSLPAVVEQKLQELEQCKDSLAQDRLSREKQFWLYYQKLLEGLSLMERMLREHKLTSQAEVDVVTAGWLEAQCDAFCLKFRLTKMQILCETYDTETLKALKKISGHLDKALRQTQQELAATQHSLQGYQAIGEEFKSLVAEFTQLQKEVDSRRWGLQQLGVWGGAQGQGQGQGQSQGQEGSSSPS